MSVDLGTDLDQLVSLHTHVICAWPDEEGGCTRQASWTLVQLHLRPTLPCMRLPLCTEHRQTIEGQERAFIAAKPRAVIICTLHHRPVERRARWEEL